MYETILIPTDGRSDTQPAVSQGLSLARLCGATVHVLYVIDIAYVLEYTFGDRNDEFDTRMAELEDQGKRATAKIAEEATPFDVDVIRVVRHGPPVETILEYAETNGIDLIVMGPHRRRRLDRLLVRSVTEAVGRATDIPVLSVRGSAEERINEPDRPPRVPDWSGDHIDPSR